MTSAISVRNLSKKFERRGMLVHALDGISCEIEQRAFISVLGPSGCGKSTLLRMIAGLIPYEGGEILVNGRPIVGPSDEIGVVFQTANLLPWLNVRDNLRLGVQIRRIARPNIEDELASMIELLGLKGFETSYPHELSGGMQQRSALGQTLMLHPELLLMDEPFGALDALTRDRMNLELLRMWEAQRQTVFFVTHSIQESVFLSDRVLVFSPRPGRIIADIKIDLPRPRQLGQIRMSQEFNGYVLKLAELMGVS
jgi:NitT/TauT family transport system ATP-binding protein